jgi:hypothetical protein
VAALKVALRELPSLVSAPKPPTTVVGHVPKPRVVPVYVLEDMSTPGVVPPSPECPEEEEDDMECSIGIGDSEHAAYRAAKWEEQRPHTVLVEVPGVEGAVPVLPTALAAALSACGWMPIPTPLTSTPAQA